VMRSLIKTVCPLICFVVLIASKWVGAQESAILAGKSNFELSLRGKTIPVFLYKPEAYSGKRMIVVLHGLNRNADEYRDHACAMGDRFGALIVAPKFDTKQFPSIKYQRGGIVTEQNQVAPKDEWTYQLIPDIVSAIRDREKNQDLPFYMIGHSAGAQFIVRMSAFLEPGAKRLVAANPGSLLFPRSDMPFGYGFGALPQELSSAEQIKSYLAAPLTIFLGTEDNRPDENFDDSPDAMTQGAGRYQRGKACYEFGKKLAQENDWPFHWQIVEAPGVGHDHEAMFNHDACQSALFGEE
jgi:pimeloyl-ACP methyl ester carboxylesterase